jgi:Flp pilus assembly protein TadB
MNWAIPAALLAAAILFAPPVRPRPAAVTVSPRRMPSGALRATLAVAVTTGCVAVLGPVPGLLAALTLLPAAIFVVKHLERGPLRLVPDRALALALDLLAAALRSGQPVGTALTLAAPAAGGSRQAALNQVAGLLRLGADPAEAWRSVADDDEALAPAAHAACRSADSGIRLAGGMEQVAADVRDQVRATAEARAHRAGVLAMAPLGLCFLPAFVCLGVVPVVVGIARGVFTTLPG